MNKRIKNIGNQRQAIQLREKSNYTRKELNILAKASGIKYFAKFTKHDLAEKLGIQLTNNNGFVPRENMDYTRKELSLLAKEAKIKFFYKMDKHEIAEKLGIELSAKKKPRRCAVEILNIRYPSITQAAKENQLYPNQIYTMIAKGEAKFV